MGITDKGRQIMTISDLDSNPVGDTFLFVFGPRWAQWTQPDPNATLTLKVTREVPVRVQCSVTVLWLDPTARASAQAKAVELVTRRGQNCLFATHQISQNVFSLGRNIPLGNGKILDASAVLAALQCVCAFRSSLHFFMEPIDSAPEASVSVRVVRRSIRPRSTAGAAARRCKE